MHHMAHCRIFFLYYILLIHQFAKGCSFRLFACNRYVYIFYYVRVYVKSRT